MSMRCGQPKRADTDTAAFARNTDAILDREVRKAQALQPLRASGRPPKFGVPRIESADEKDPELPLSRSGGELP